jgi:hypothetical protein
MPASSFDLPAFISRWDYQRERVANDPPFRSFYPMFHPTICSKGDSVSLLQESRRRDRDGLAVLVSGV